MISFKNFLTEHVVTGSIKGSKNGIYKVYLSQDNDVLFIIPDGEPIASIKFTKKALDLFNNSTSDPDIINQRNATEDESYSIYYDRCAILKEKYKDFLFNNYEIISSDHNISKIIDRRLTEDIVWSLSQIEGYRYKNKLENLLDTQPVSEYIFTFANYMLLDSNKKCISLVDASDNKERIGVLVNKNGYATQSKSHYLIPFTVRHISSDRVTVKILKSLSSSIPGFSKEYSYENLTTSNKEILPIEDVIAGKGHLGNSNASLNNIILGKGEIVAYHGTSASNAHDILRYGLKNNMGFDYNDKIKGHSEKNVYLTTDLQEARKYAVRASGASKRSVILKIFINNPERLVFDEDTLYYGIRKMPNSVLSEIKKRLYNIYKYNKNISWPFNTIEDYAIKEKLTYKDMDISLSCIEKLLDYRIKATDSILAAINYYCLKGSKVFAYRGTIPAKDVTVLESFKSELYKGTYADEDSYNSIHKSVKYGKIN